MVLTIKRSQHNNLEYQSTKLKNSLLKFIKIFQIDKLCITNFHFTL